MSLQIFIFDQFWKHTGMWFDSYSKATLLKNKFENFNILIHSMYKTGIKILIRRQPCWSGLCQPDLGLALLRLSDQDWGQKMHKSVEDNVAFNRCLRYLYRCWDTLRAWESWKPAEILSPKKSRGWGGVHHIDDYWGGLNIGDYWCGCILMFDCGLHHMRIKAGLWLYWWESWFAAEC